MCVLSPVTLVENFGLPILFFVLTNSLHLENIYLTIEEKVDVKQTRTLVLCTFYLFSMWFSLFCLKASPSILDQEEDVSPWF